MGAKDDELAAFLWRVLPAQVVTVALACGERALQAALPALQRTAGEVMPQAPDYLRQQFEDDGAAFAVLRDHFHIRQDGLIVPKSRDRPNTDLEYAAIQYLILEWDYGYRGTAGYDA